MWDPYAEFQSTTLPNGLSVYAAYWEGRPWETIGFLIHSGAEQDPIGLEGLAHFVEHTVSRNTIVSQNELRAFFENCGGAISLGTTGYPYTRYGLFVPADTAILAKAFSIFGHMLFSARIEESIEYEREVIIGEFHEHYRTTLNLDLTIREHKALFTGYWLERFVRPLGNPKSVGQITKEQLQSYYDTHYTPANMSIVCVGGMTLTELVKLLSESPFVVSKKGVRTPLPTPTIDVLPPLETRHVVNMSEHITGPVEVGTYYSAAKIPGNINGRVVRILEKMLNEVFEEEVRERLALTYNIQSSRHNFRYFYGFSINCSAFKLTAIDNIEEIVNFCIASLKDREDLFKRVKRHALTQNFMIDPTGRSICEGALDDLIEGQRIISLEEIGNDLERVTMDDVVGLLRWLRPEQRWTLIMRP